MSDLENKWLESMDDGTPSPFSSPADIWATPFVIADVSNAVGGVLPISGNANSSIIVTGGNEKLNEALRNVFSPTKKENPRPALQIVQNNAAVNVIPRSPSLIQEMALQNIGYELESRIFNASSISQVLELVRIELLRKIREFESSEYLSTRKNIQLIGEKWIQITLFLQNEMVDDFLGVLSDIEQLADITVTDSLVLWEKKDSDMFGKYASSEIEKMGLFIEWQKWTHSYALIGGSKLRYQELIDAIFGSITPVVAKKILSLAKDMNEAFIDKNTWLLNNISYQQNITDMRENNDIFTEYRIIISENQQNALFLLDGTKDFVMRKIAKKIQEKDPERSFSIDTKTLSFIDQDNERRQDLIDVLNEFALLGIAIECSEYNIGA